MTVLMTVASLAARGTPAEAVGRIQRSYERMLRLIEDLLDFASDLPNVYDDGDRLI